MNALWLVHTQAGPIHKQDPHTSRTHTQAGPIHKRDPYTSRTHTQAGPIHKQINNNALLSGFTRPQAIINKPLILFENNYWKTDIVQ